MKICIDCINSATFDRVFYPGKFLKRILPEIILLGIVFLGLSGCSSTIEFPSIFNKSSSTFNENGLSVKTNPIWWQGNAQAVWANLQPFSAKQLMMMRQNTTDPEKQGWISLALLSKQNST